MAKKERNDRGASIQLYEVEALARVLLPEMQKFFESEKLCEIVEPLYSEEEGRWSTAAPKFVPNVPPAIYAPALKTA